MGGGGGNEYPGCRREAPFVLTVGFLGAGVPGVAQQVRHVRPAQHLAVGDQDLDEGRHGAQVFGGTRGRRVGPQQRRSHAHAQVAGRHQVVRAAPRDVVQHAQEVAQQMVVGSGQLIDDPARAGTAHKREKQAEAVRNAQRSTQSTCRPTWRRGDCRTTVFGPLLRTVRPRWRADLTTPGAYATGPPPRRLTPPSRFRQLARPGLDLDRTWFYKQTHGGTMLLQYHYRQDLRVIEHHVVVLFCTSV